jgi:hypothetical protein
MKPSFEVSPDVRKLAEFLRECEKASYAEMNRRTGRNINGADRYVLYGALRRLQREHDLVFVVERGVGITRATNGQVASLSTDHIIRKTGRVIRRGRKLQPIVDTQALNNDQRDAFFIGRAVTQMLDATVGKKMRSKIADEIKDRGGEAVDIKDVVALFQRRAH